MCVDEISSRARAIHFSSIVFDTHVDTPQRLFFDQFDLAKRDPEGCVDIPRLREGGVGADLLCFMGSGRDHGRCSDPARVGFARSRRKANRNS